MSNYLSVRNLTVKSGMLEPIGTALPNEFFKRATSQSFEIGLARTLLKRKPVFLFRHYLSYTRSSKQ